MSTEWVEHYLKEDGIYYSEELDSAAVLVRVYEYCPGRFEAGGSLNRLLMVAVMAEKEVYIFPTLREVKKAGWERVVI